jgi:hypothetical protein
MVSLLEAAYMAVAFVVFVIVVAIGGNVLTAVQGTQGSGIAGCTAALVNSGHHHRTSPRCVRDGPQGISHIRGASPSFSFFHIPSVRWDT